MEETTEKLTLEIDDLIGHTYHSKPNSLTKIVRVTATQAIDEKGNKFRRQLSHGDVRIIGEKPWFSDSTLLNGKALSEFRQALGRKSTIARIENASRELIASGFKNVLTNDLESLCFFMEKMKDLVK